jgi:hypothetical protein
MASIKLNDRAHEATGHSNSAVLNRFYTDELLKVESQKFDLLNSEELEILLSKL